MAKIKRNVNIINQDFCFDFKLLYSGIEQDRFHYRNSFLDCFSLSYMIKGSGELIINNKKHVIKQGDIFFLPPSVPYLQSSDAINPYNYFYISFYGSNSFFLLEKCGINVNNPVLHDVNSEFVCNKFKEVFDYCAENSLASICKANLAFFEILCFLINRNENNKKIVKLSKYQLVEQAQRYIENNYFQDITVAEICKSLYTNRSSFTMLFKKVCGVPLSEYIINFRIDQAMRLLQNTDLSASNIAEKVGFKDYTAFYKRFRAKTGRSPKVYRRENRHER